MSNINEKANNRSLVCEPMTWEKINSHPFPTKDTPVEELRQICLDYMAVQLTFPWTPNSSFNYVQWRGKEPRVNEGVVYGGHPYVSCVASTTYHAMYYYDQKTGVLDTAAMGKKYNLIMGNQCSGNASWGWARVCSAATWGGTQCINPAHGVLRVGPYTYDDNLTDFYKQQIHTHHDICVPNGEQVMFESYALLEKADGVSNYTRNGGHVRMAATAAHVVRNEDGTINGDKSWCDFQEQCDTRIEKLQKDGTGIHIMCGFRRYTFRKLYNDGYLPFTMPEFHGKQEILPAGLTFGHEKDTITYDELQAARVKCNYALSDFEIIIENPKKETVYYGFSFVERAAFTGKNLPFGYATRMTAPYAGYAGGGNTITINCRIGTGEKLFLYKGEFVKDPAKENDITCLVAEPLTWDRLNRIPVATADMSEDEIRNICRELMEIQLSFTWTPNQNFDIPRGADTLTLERGTVYGGCPYVACTWNSVYHVMEYYDEETGVMDSASYGNKFQTMFGNQCSGSAFWGWARACNAHDWDGTSQMTVKHGCLRVGPYTYDDALDTYFEKNTHDIIAENGEQVMFESYAATKVADGIVCYKGRAGHVRMVSQPVTVVRNADGTIDGDKSCMAFQHQHPTHKPWPQKNGETFMRQGGVHTVRSFNELLKDGYLPFTLPELCGKKAVDKAWAKIDYEGKEISIDTLNSLTVEANYPIVNISATVHDSMPTHWKPIYEKKVLTDLSKLGHKSYSTRGIADEEKLSGMLAEGPQIEIRTLLGNGENVLLFKGKLV
ncbi:MAG: hypothetical protein IJC84_04795 [Clostridia bacterium]|nr:hypothetical protein [Clostridia bacterium]